MSISTDQSNAHHATILDGKVVRDHIAQTLIEKVKTLSFVPALAIVQVGDIPESDAFIRQKNLFAAKIGVTSLHKKFPNSISEQELIKEIEILNKDTQIQGIIVQLPLPAHIDKNMIIESILPEKDADGLHSVNVQKLIANDPTGIVPATARGIRTLCHYYHIDLKGKHIAVIGTSALVGQPVAHVCTNEGGIVTSCNRDTKHIPEVTKKSDIIIVAAGSPKLITAQYVEKGQTVIDVGITSVHAHNEKSEMIKKLVGDVDFDEVSKIVSAITPVPGGVGPLTVASLFENVVDAAIKMIK